MIVWQFLLSEEKNDESSAISENCNESKPQSSGHQRGRWWRRQGGGKLSGTRLHLIKKRRICYE